MTKLAYEQFADLISTVLKNQNYSTDVQQTSYDDLAADEGLPPELRIFMRRAAGVWQFLIDNEIEGIEPLITSTNLVATPNSLEDLTKRINDYFPPEHRGYAFIIVQMTVNLMNANR